MSALSGMITKPGTRNGRSTTSLTLAVGLLYEFTALMISKTSCAIASKN